MEFSRKRYLQFLIFMLMVVTFLPIAYHNLPFPIRSFKYFWGPLWLLSFIGLKPSIISNRLIIQFLVYVFFIVIVFPIIIWYNPDDLYMSNNVYGETYIYAIGLSVFTYLIIERDYIFIAKLSKWILIFLFTTTIMTLISAYIDPMYARSLSGGAGFDSDSSQGRLFYRLGGALYSYGQSMSFLFPILIYYYKDKDFNAFPKKTILMFIILLFLAILQMQFFANIVAAFLSIVVSILGMKRIKVSVFIIGLLLIFIVIIPTTIYSDSLIYLSTVFDTGSQNQYKLLDMANFIDSGGVVDEGTGAGSRMARYPELLNAFIHSPFWGNFSNKEAFDIANAFHLYLGSKLAALGSVAFLFFVSLHYKFIRRNIIMYRNSEYVFYYTVSIATFIAISLMKQIVGREVWLTYFIFLPSLYFLPYLNKKKKNEK